MRGIKVYEGEMRGNTFIPAGSAVPSSEAGKMVVGEAGADWRGVGSGISGSLTADQGTPGKSKFQVAMESAVAKAGGFKKATGALAALLYHMEGGFESIPTRQLGRLAQEALGVGAFDSLLVDAQHKRLIEGYKLREPLWEKLIPMPRVLSDFKTNYAIQVGSLGILPVVRRGAPYPEKQFTDDSASYAALKYGCTYGVTLEAAANDDLGQLAKINLMMGSAMAQTIEAYVFGTLINDNPTAYDSTALFHANHNNNLGASTALSHDNLEAACKKLQAQTDLDGEPLNILPKYLIVHPDEQYTAQRLTAPYAMERPGTGNRDVNVFAGKLEVIVTSRVTSGRFYVAADPRLFDWIELGFLGGKREPEFFEEASNAGRWFDFDEKRYKVRQVFGGIVCDYRGIVRGNVA